MNHKPRLGEVFAITALHTAFEQRPAPGYYFKGEYHNFWEIVLVLNGTVNATAGSEVFTIAAGQAIIHEPMEFHRLGVDAQSGAHIIIFTFSAKGMPELSSRVFELPDTEDARHILCELKSAFNFSGLFVGTAKTDSTDYQIALKKLEIFILETITNKVKTTDIVKTRSAENYTLIVNILKNNLNKSFTISDIARLCNMSEIGVKKVFSKHSGMGVMAYFNKMKITAATDMIRSGISVKETAERLGFSSQNYFSTVFKRVTGHSPSYYRQ